MILIDALPKSEKEKIILDPGGKIDGEYYISQVRQEWFMDNHAELAESEVPLNDSQYEELKNIDNYWKMNAEKWRDEGII